MRQTILHPLLICCALAGAMAQAQDSVTLNIRDVIDRPALFYAVENATSGAVLVPQSGQKADSWDHLAGQLHARGISALALNFTSSEDVSTAIDFLLSKGAQDITLIGASVGGASVLRVLNRNRFTEVERAILLGTGEGDASASQGVRKLFVIAENDMFAGQTHASFRKASGPKELIVFPGAQHGQELFNGPHKEELEHLILSFLNGAPAE